MTTIYLVTLAPRGAMKLEEFSTFPEVIKHAKPYLNRAHSFAITGGSYLAYS